MLQIRYFSSERSDDRYISLADTQEILGIDRPEDLDGSEIAQAIRDGRHAEIMEHCKNDVRATFQVYKMITGVAF